MAFFPQIRPDYGRFGVLCNWKVEESDRLDAPIDDDLVVSALEAQAEEHERLATKYRAMVAVIEEYGVDRCKLAAHRRNFSKPMNQLDQNIVAALGPTAEPFDD